MILNNTIFIWNRNFFYIFEKINPNKNSILALNIEVERVQYTVFNYF